MRVFVYGTLLKGLERNKILGTSPCLGPALISAMLYDLGSYPGIKEGSEPVVGELYDVDASVLELLDQIEGYVRSNPGDSLYRRQTAPVQCFSDGRHLEAFAYYYAPPIDGREIIAHGDYRRYRLESKDEEQWLIAYGSNLSTQRLKQRVGQISDTKTGFIEGYELSFNKAGANGNTYANTRYIGTHVACPAVAYKLALEQAEMLDRFEGVPTHYMRVAIPFATVSGVEIVQSYITHPNKLVPERRPKDEYLGHIQKGYREHALDATYLEHALGRVTRLPCR
ncbi:gamma-glutamylcyclotransferase [Nitrococcus mobilis]|uniref:Gamma-glutamylcyclotransferase AIG2-like domain-containing protein n=1 Tax=Nitrococcus mobilis Nb-231 TaxID=314278 RepID=A4BP38_9GAMM|nr:gamma-glutamylcyclotransferase [Nitrococcus mobilis]EAR22339.1 hypothetical protein NB231_11404 [Nitrococcus mobilis Nb-231]